MLFQNRCTNKANRLTQLLQGTFDLIVLRNLAAMGPQHAYQIVDFSGSLTDFSS